MFLLILYFLFILSGLQGSDLNVIGKRGAKKCFYKSLSLTIYGCVNYVL